MTIEVEKYKGNGSIPVAENDRQFLKSPEHFLNAIAAEQDLFAVNGQKPDFLLRPDLMDL